MELVELVEFVEFVELVELVELVLESLGLVTLRLILSLLSLSPYSVRSSEDISRSDLGQLLIQTGHQVTQGQSCTGNLVLLILQSQTGPSQGEGRGPITGGPAKLFVLT